MEKHRIVQVGLGNRGETAIKCFLQLSDRVELVGVCELNEERLKKVSEKYEIEEKKRFKDVKQMLKSCRPDLFSFCTLPTIRLELIELASQYGVKGILFEKPMAASLEEAKKIIGLCRKKGLKAAVCHQHKYFQGFQRMKKIIDSGSIGKITYIHASCQPWFSQLGTHYIDYAIWANGGHAPVSVAGHIHGRRMLDDTHPSPDYMLGKIVFSNGVHATVEFGYMAQRHHKHCESYETQDFPISFWEDDRLTVYGDTGYVWAECNGRWGAFTKETNGRIEGGKGNAYHDEVINPQAQVLFTQEFLDWIDERRTDCACDVNLAYSGFETGIAIIYSALRHTRVDLPLKSGTQKDELKWMRQLLPECPRRDFAKG